MPLKLIVANVVVFALVHLAGVAPWLEMPGRLAQLAHLPWTPLTYMFTQADVLHLLFNMLWLYWFGELYLTLRGQWQLLGLYVAGGLAGAATFLIFVHSGMLIGSSAAVLAVVVGAAWTMPNFELNLMLLGPVKLKWIALISVALFALTDVVHLGGAVGGVLYCVMPRIHWRRRLQQGTESDEAILNRLLDKVRRSGYNSLNASERKQLMNLSKKL